MKKAPILPPISENKFLDHVLQFAHLYRWRVAHFRPAKTNKGWRTAVQGDGVGFPDLVLVRERIVWAELKADKGDVSIEQAAWLKALADAGQECYVWRPSLWHCIVEVLEARKSPRIFG